MSGLLIIKCGNNVTFEGRDCLNKTTHQVKLNVMQDFILVGCDFNCYNFDYF